MGAVLHAEVPAVPATIGAMVTEIGFVSLLVAGFGGLAGVLVYVAVRVARGSSR